MPVEKILIVDDEFLIRSYLAEALQRNRYEVITAGGRQEAADLLDQHHFDMVITDMKMPDGSGIDVLRKAKEICPNTLVIIITAFGTIENAVEAMKLGAFNYLIKPFTPETLETIIQKAVEHKKVVEENRYLRQEGHHGRGVYPIIAESGVMKKIISNVKQVAKSHASVFISGESGTGKEVIAYAIHDNSPRRHKPYIRVNCAAIPETLVESEFFGHEKGAFTGADAKRMGRFELSNGGTLLLDEITEIPLALQPKLLRVIQEGELERVGGSKSVVVDVRLISTSNRNLEEAIRDKIFRGDLYYRLNVVPIVLPPLRDRREDIIPLAELFIERLSIENHKKKKALTDAAKRLLLDYSWPGNIRELANIIERAIVMDLDDLIDAEHIWLDGTGVLPEISTPAGLPIGLTMEELEKRFILQTLETSDQNKTKAAQTLGISIRTLRNKLQEYQLKH